MKKTLSQFSTFTGEDLPNLGEYERKIVELQRIYKAISKKTPYYFWLPIKQKDEEWFLHCFKEGKNLYNKSHSKEAFKNELKIKFSQSFT